MNTIQIKLSNANAMNKAKPIISTVEIFLLKKGIKISPEEKLDLSDSIASWLTSINFAIVE